MRSYEVARSLFSFLAFCAWSIVVIGVLVALIGAGGGSRYGGAGAGLLAMVPGLSIGIAGLLLVAFVQIGRATVDTAEYSQQMLKVSRDQLEVSKQSLNPGSQNSTSWATEMDEADKSKRPSFGEPSASEPHRSDNAPTTDVGTPPAKLAALPKDINGFLPLNSEGTLLEYRGREIKFSSGKYDLAGQKFSNVNTLKKYLNNLKDLSS
ncbi:hypothetical protein OAN307_c31620 [Octadecabacter antarcticus 307]|uniref:Uncharacterized protein n=1 Tax=Octadecabacter antarcticus 307 TaxID=391626 RepID=M9RFU3_9RHOB|nr:hypothetical protein [Octadecabacter antarcticus]AGI68695.1 hypothetical protein OAN307_c31620 [Octadecabacter antarcticus 307]